jgi:cytoskeletal protein CcmA (bactofilin family)
VREERGQIAGDLIIAEPCTLWGVVGGSVNVADGGKFYLRGTVCGNLLVEDGGRVHIFGNVVGHVTIEEGAKLVHGGVIGGDAINNGGRLYIEATGKVQGKIKTRKGAQTEFAPGVKPPS